MLLACFKWNCKNIPNDGFSHSFFSALVFPQCEKRMARMWKSRHIVCTKRIVYACILETSMWTHSHCLAHKRHNEKRQLPGILCTRPSFSTLDNFHRNFRISFSFCGIPLRTTEHLVFGSCYRSLQISHAIFKTFKIIIRFLVLGQESSLDRIIQLLQKRWSTRHSLLLQPFDGDLKIEIFEICSKLMV